MIRIYLYLLSRLAPRAADRRLERRGYIAYDIHGRPRLTDAGRALLADNIDPDPWPGDRLRPPTRRP